MYKVVIVDDESFIIDGLKDAIDWEGYNFEIVYTSTNPESVLSYFKDNSVDLLMTDIAMPQMNGIELIHQVKIISPHVAIIVLSAYDNFNFVRTALRNGAENYLLKPLDSNELGESIRSIAEHLGERLKQSDAYGTTMLNFRSIFIENWVKDALNPIDFHTRAEMLGINLQLSHFTVLIFSTQQENTQGMAELLDGVLSIFLGKFQSHFYFENAKTLVCILSGDDILTDRGRLNSSIDEIRDHFSFPFFVSIGTTVDNYEDVSISYRTANRYLFLRFTLLENIICNEIPLPINTSNIIEQNFLQIEEEEYIFQVTTLFSPSLSDQQRMDIQLAIVHHGILQTNGENIESTILKSVSEVCCETRNLNRVLQYIKSFIGTCYQILRERQETQSNNYNYVDLVIQSIQDVSNKDISLKTLAAQMDMHPSYLGNIFHQQTGYYFNDYLNNERLRYAAKLLETTSLKLKDIVDKAGFSSQTYFNRVFKRQFGVSPLSYRRESKLKNP